MSFEASNKYFLQDFRRRLSGINSYDEKINYYNNSLKKDVWKRIHEYYNKDKIKSKSEFYTDLLSYFGVFEADLIILNLLLEEDLFNFIDDIKILPKKKFNFEYNILSDIYSSLFMHEKRDFEVFFENIKSQSRSLLNVNDNSWYNENQNKHPFVNSFISKLTSISIDGQSINMDIFINVLIVWYRIEIFNNPFHSSKAIVMTNKLNKEFDKDNFAVESKEILFDFIDKVIALSGYLFSYSWLGYIPLTNCLPKDAQNGLIIQTENLLSKYERYKYAQNLTNLSFGKLIDSYDIDKVYENEILVMKEIKKRFSNNIFPTSEELQSIMSDKNLNANLKELFIRTFYLFEYLS